MHAKSSRSFQLSRIEPHKLGREGINRLLDGCITVPNFGDPKKKSRAIKISAFLSHADNPNTAGDVTAINEWVGANYQHRPYLRGDQYIKSRSKSGERLITNQHSELPSSDTIAVGYTDEQPTVNQSTIRFLREMRIPGDVGYREKSFRKFDDLFVKRGLITDSGFGLKYLKTFLANPSSVEETEPTTYSSTPAVSRLAAVRDMAVALYESQNYQLTNIIRCTTLQTEGIDKSDIGTLGSVSNYLRFQVNEERHRPDYDDLDLVDRSGEALWDAEKRLFRRIQTGHQEFAEYIDRFQPILDTIAQMEGNPWGEGYTFVTVLNEPVTGDGEVVEHPQLGDMLTRDEADYNEAIALFNWQQLNPDKVIGEIKRSTWKIPLLKDSAVEFNVTIFCFEHTRNPTFTEQARVEWEEEKERRGIKVPVCNLLRREKEGDKSSPYIFSPHYDSFRDVNDRMMSSFIRQPNFTGVGGKGDCVVYSMMPFINYEDMLINHILNWSADMNNWFIEVNKDKQTIRAKKFDIVLGFKPEYYYGCDGPTKRPALSTRLIMAIRYEDEEIARGKKLAPSSITPPGGWTQYNKVRRMLLHFQGDEKITFVRQADGLFGMSYHSPMDNYMNPRMYEAKKAWEGFKDKELGIWVFACPKMWDSDLMLFHLYEWVIRNLFRSNIQRIIELEDADDPTGRWVLKDSEWFQTWRNAGGNIKGVKYGVETVAFETGHLITCVWVPYDTDKNKDEPEEDTFVRSTISSSDYDALLTVVNNLESLMDQDAHGALHPSDSMKTQEGIALLINMGKLVSEYSGAPPHEDPLRATLEIIGYLKTQVGKPRVPAERMNRVRYALWEFLKNIQ